MTYKEDDLQKTVAKFLDAKKLLWCHVANERKTSPIQGKRLKDKGVKSGVPDVLIFNKVGKYNGLAIELKIKPNKVSDNQKAWLVDLALQGWQVNICYSIDEVIETVDAYLSHRVNFYKDILK